MRIHTNKGKYWKGLGDTICLAWLAEAAKGTDTPIELVATGTKAELLRMLGQQPIEDETDALEPSVAYELELQDGGKELRLWYVSTYLGVATGWTRPPVTVPEDAWNEAQEKHKTLTRKGRLPLVLLFPQTHWRPREYPAAYWIDVAWKCKALGLAPVIVLEKPDERFKNVPFFVFGLGLPVVAGLMKLASVTVGNDSMPCHLSGTIGCKTLALLGPTRPSVFAHDENVRCLQTGLTQCVGCHFQRPYRAACDVQCQALMTLHPDAVVSEIARMVTQPAFRVVDVGRRA